MARELAAQGEEIERLVLINASAANFRYRHLWASADLLGWVGASANTRTTLFLRLRQLASILEGRSTLGGLAHIARKLSRIPSVIREVREPGETAASLIDFDRLSAIYRRIDVEYVPKAYEGRIALIAAADDPESPDEMAEWWRRAGADVKLYVVPGTHNENLTQYVEELATQLRAALA
jgi:pimeloyl-ACP methyl ester carboxylesterase